MAREDWQDREDEQRRMAARERAQERPQERNDFGQADYSTDYGYDAERGEAYRRYEGRDYGRPTDDRPIDRRPIDGRDDPPVGQPRTWMERAGEIFTPASARGPRVEARPVRSRRGPSDRVLWAVIVERLEDERGLDLRGVEVIVEDAEVTLNGVVRHKADKRRIEDVADIDGVRHVQNNLRAHDRGHWTFF